MMQKLGAENELQKYKYAPDQAVLGTCYQEAWAKRTLRREKWRGQLRLSLTNTYHEWPVIVALSGPICARAPDP